MMYMTCRLKVFNFHDKGTFGNNIENN